MELLKHDSTTFNTQRLIQWCLGIAEGMEFLAYKKVHIQNLLSSEICTCSQLFRSKSCMFMYAHIFR